MLVIHWSLKRKMYCVICFFGSLSLSIDEEELCSHDNDLVRYTVRQYGYENPLRVLLLGLTQRDEKSAWTVVPNGGRFKLKRSRTAQAPEIQFGTTLFNLDNVLKGNSSISDDFYDFVDNFTRRQIKFENVADWTNHKQCHQLAIPSSSSEYENMFIRTMIKTVHNSLYGDSLGKISKKFYRNLSKMSFRHPPSSRCFYLMTYAFYIQKAFN